MLLASLAESSSWMGLPRLLHYVLLTPPPRPHSVGEAYHYWIASCVNANPDFEIVLWATDDCETLAASQPPSIASLYRNFSRLESGRALLGVEGALVGEHAVGKGLGRVGRQDGA